MKHYEIDYKAGVKKIRTELSKYITKNQIKALVIGISGGMDSCLCAALAKPVCDKLGIKLIGVTLPSATNEKEENRRAYLTGYAFCNDFRSVNISSYFEAFEDLNGTLDPTESNVKDWKIRNGNIKARIRMIYLYNEASKNCGMVLSTDNLTEYLLGFWTLHGDVGDYGMIQNLWKTEVYNMAEWLAENEYKNNPEAVDALTLTVSALATDGLGITSLGDLGQILPDWRGSSRDGYKEVDRILQIWLSKDELQPTQEKILESSYSNHPVIKRHLCTDFKRNNPINIPRKSIFKKTYMK